MGDPGSDPKTVHKGTVVAIVILGHNFKENIWFMPLSPVSHTPLSLRPGRFFGTVPANSISRPVLGLKGFFLRLNSCCFVACDRSDM